MNLPKKFADKIVIWPDYTGGCWEWVGAKNNHGYGSLKWEGKTFRAHRFTYQMLVGPIPEGLHLDHFLMNDGNKAGCSKACVNPAHLEPVTNKENVRRGNSGKATAARQRAKSYCPKGHPYDEANTIHYKGWRKCRACQSISNKTYTLLNRNTKETNGTKEENTGRTIEDSTFDTCTD